MRGLRSVFRKYSQTMVVIGALVVFATFIVREQIRDDLRDLVSDIALAKAVFEVRGDIAEISDNLESLGVSLDFVYARVLPLRTPEDAAPHDSAVIIGRLTPVQSHLKYLIRAVRNISSLDERIGAVDLKAKADVVRSEIEHAQKQCDSALGELLAQPPGGRITTESVSRYANEYEGPLVLENDKLRKEVANLEQQTLLEGERVELAKEASLYVVTAVSLLLFALGWGLALAARLQGSESVES